MGAAIDPVKAADEFGGSENRRHDGGEGNAGENKVFEIAEMFAAEVLPIGETFVEEFENPPSRRGKKKEEKKIFAGAKPKGSSGAAFDQSVNEEDVTEP